MDKNMLKYKDIIILASTIVCLTIMSLTPILTYIGIVVFTVFFILINNKYNKAKDVIIPKLAIVLLLFQNFGIGLGAHIGGNTSNTLSLITQIPSLFIVISCIFIFFNKRCINTIDKIFSVLLIIVIIYFFVGNGPLTVKLVYARNFTVFYLAFVMGEYYLYNKKIRTDYLQFFIKIAIIAGVFGIVGMILGKDFYITMGVNEIYNAKRNFAYVDGLPGNFKTLVNSVWVNRLASLYFEPVNFSYFMALAVIISICISNKKTLIFLFVCSILTFGKGGILLLSASLVCVLLHRIIEISRHKINFFKIDDSQRIWKIINFLMITSIIILSFYIHIFMPNSFGTYMHFYGIYSGIKIIFFNPLGHGLGSAGNILRAITENGSYDVSETGLINMAYQIGLIGVFIFILILYKMSNYTLSNYKNLDKIKNETLYLFFSYIPIILIIVSIFQENTLSPQVIIPYMLIAGSTSKRSEIDERSCNNNTILQ